MGRERLPAKKQVGKKPDGKKKEVLSKSKLPLEGKVIYLDGASNKLKSDLLILGATIETFFHKEIYCLITSRGKEEDYKKGNATNLTVHSPGTPSPFVDSPAISSPADKPSLNDLKLPRGKRLVAAAAKGKGKIDIIQQAKDWGTRIVHTNSAERFVAKEKLKLKGHHVTRSSSTSSKEPITKTKILKSPFVKFDSSTNQYKPVHEELKNWPMIKVDAPLWTSPFVGTPNNTVEERADRCVTDDKEERDALDSGTPKETGKEKQKIPDLLTKREMRILQEEEKRVESKKGFCECCHEHFFDIDKHLKGTAHKKYTQKSDNYLTLDLVINQGPNLDKFLDDVIKYHDDHVKEGLSGGPESSAKQNHECATSDQVQLVSPIKQKISPPAHKKTTPKTQRRSFAQEDEARKAQTVSTQHKNNKNSIVEDLLVQTVGQEQTGNTADSNRTGVVAGDMNEMGVKVKENKDIESSKSRKGGNAANVSVEKQHKTVEKQTVVIPRTRRVVGKSTDTVVAENAHEKVDSVSPRTRRAVGKSTNEVVAENTHEKKDVVSLRTRRVSKTNATVSETPGKKVISPKRRKSDINEDSIIETNEAVINTEPTTETNSLKSRVAADQVKLPNEIEIKLQSSEVVDRPKVQSRKLEVSNSKVDVTVKVNSTIETVNSHKPSIIEGNDKISNTDISKNDTGKDNLCNGKKAPANKLELKIRKDDTNNHSDFQDSLQKAGLVVSPTTPTVASILGGQKRKRESVSFSEESTAKRKQRSSSMKKAANVKMTAAHSKLQAALGQEGTCTSTPRTKKPTGILKDTYTPTSSHKRRVKLKKNWRLLSEKSMGKLLKSDPHSEPFEGFQLAGLHDVPSDATFVDLSEIDLPDDAEVEWSYAGVGQEELTFTTMELDISATFDEEDGEEWADTVASYIDDSINKAMSAPPLVNMMLLPPSPRKHNSRISKRLNSSLVEEENVRPHLEVHLKKRKTGWEKPKEHKKEINSLKINDPVDVTNENATTSSMDCKEASMITNIGSIPPSPSVPNTAPSLNDSNITGVPLKCTPQLSSIIEDQSETVRNHLPYTGGVKKLDIEDDRMSISSDASTVIGIQTGTGSGAQNHMQNNNDDDQEDDRMSTFSNASTVIGIQTGTGNGAQNKDMPNNNNDDDEDDEDDEVIEFNFDSPQRKQKFTPLKSSDFKTDGTPKKAVKITTGPDGSPVIVNRPRQRCVSSDFHPKSLGLDQLKSTEATSNKVKGGETSKDLRIVNYKLLQTDSKTQSKTHTMKVSVSPLKSATSSRLSPNKRSSNLKRSPKKLKPLLDGFDGSSKGQVKGHAVPVTDGERNYKNWKYAKINTKSQITPRTVKNVKPVKSGTEGISPKVSYTEYKQLMRESTNTTPTQPSKPNVSSRQKKYLTSPRKNRTNTTKKRLSSPGKPLRSRKNPYDF